MQFNVVTGAPCAGKSTYIREHKKDGDVVIDFDSIAIAFGAEKSHECSELQSLAARYARKGAMDVLVENRNTKLPGDVWIAWALPSKKDRKALDGLGAVFHELDTTMEVCIERAENDGRPQRTLNGIDTYFAKLGTGQGLKLSEMER